MSYLIKILGLFIVLSQCVHGTEYRINEYLKGDIRGFLGYKTVWAFGTKEEDLGSISDYPEMGIVLQNNFTDDLNCYFFGRYSRRLIEAAVYAQCEATLPNFADDLVIKIKGGHIMNDFGLYNTTRVNPRTRQGIYLPQAIYPATIKGELASGLGFGLTAHYKNFDFSYSIEAKTVFYPESEAKAWSTRLNSIGSKFGDAHLATLQWTSDDSTLKLKLSAQQIDLGNDYANVPRRISAGLPNVVNRIIMPSIEWRHDKLMLSAEGMALKSTGIDKLAYAYSLMGTYDINDEWTARVNYNQFISPFKATGIAAIREKHQDFNVGLQWHKGNWVVGGQANWVQGARFVNYGSFLDDPNGYKSFFVISGNIAYFFD